VHDFLWLWLNVMVDVIGCLEIRIIASMVVFLERIVNGKHRAGTDCSKARFDRQIFEAFRLEFMNRMNKLKFSIILLFFWTPESNRINPSEIRIKWNANSKDFQFV
jgi:hypothetical protein